MTKGIFPTISIPDIIHSLAGWGLSISQEQLIRPTPEFVEGVYCACLQQVTGITHEDVHEPVQAALATLDDPNHVSYYQPHRFGVASNYSQGHLLFRLGAQHYSLPSVSSPS